VSPNPPGGLLEGFCPESAQEDQIAINAGGQVLFIRLADIVWLQAVENGVELHVGEATHLCCVTLGALAARLPPEQFLHTSPTTLVNCAQIAHLRPVSQGGYDVLLRNGACLPLGRGHGQRARRPGSAVPRAPKATLPWRLRPRGLASN
jgi:DNA-binding LytR/AlgR family response regulator